MYSLSEQDRIRLRTEISSLGFTTFGPPAVSEEIFESLCAEAANQRTNGWERSSESEHVWRANLGPVGQALLTSQSTLDLLREAVGQEVAPSFEASCFTYFDEPGHFLGVHQDRLTTCFVTIIIYLHASWPNTAPPGPGLGLFVFDPNPSPASDPILRVTARPNRIVIGRGSEFPHGRPSLQTGESVHALTACFAPVHIPYSLEEPDSQRSHDETISVNVMAKSDRAARLVEEGHTAWQEENISYAHQCFEKALAVDSFNDMAWSGLGFVLWSQGDFEAARQAFAEAVDRNGYNPAHWSNLGLCMRELRQFQQAINLFAVALMLDPTYAPALNEWGNVLQDMEQYDDAIPYYYRALTLDPSRAVVHHNLGVAYVRLNALDLAFDAFVSALDRDPNYAPSLEEIGILCGAAGDLKRADEMFARAGTSRATALGQALRITSEAST